jgi:hypothetical protein
MISNNRLGAYLQNRWLEWYYRNGGEQIVGPLRESRPPARHSPGCNSGHFRAGPSKANAGR